MNEDHNKTSAEWSPNHLARREVYTAINRSILGDNAQKSKTTQTNINEHVPLPIAGLLGNEKDN